MPGRQNPRKRLIIIKCCPFPFHSREGRGSYCSPLEWRDSSGASRRGQVGAPHYLEEGCGEAQQALYQGVPQCPPLGPLLLFTGDTTWRHHQQASSRCCTPVPSLPLPHLLPAALLGLPLLLSLDELHLVASHWDLTQRSQRSPRDRTEASSTACAPRRP